MPFGMIASEEYGIISKKVYWMRSKFLLAAMAITLGTASSVAAQDNPELAVESAISETGAESESSQADSAIKPEKITDRTHPDYIRCRSEKVIGSLAKKRKRCMTNREWKMVSAEGNKRANELVEEHRATSVSNN